MARRACLEGATTTVVVRIHGIRCNVLKVAVECVRENLGGDEGPTHNDRGRDDEDEALSNPEDGKDSEEEASHVKTRRRALPEKGSACSPIRELFGRLRPSALELPVCGEAG